MHLHHVVAEIAASSEHLSRTSAPRSGALVVSSTCGNVARTGLALQVAGPIRPSRRELVALSAILVGGGFYR